MSPDMVCFGFWVAYTETILCLGHAGGVSSGALMLGRRFVSSRSLLLIGVSSGAQIHGRRFVAPETS